MPRKQWFDNRKKEEFICRKRQEFETTKCRQPPLNYFQLQFVLFDYIVNKMWSSLYSDRFYCILVIYQRYLQHICQSLENVAVGCRSCAIRCDFYTLKCSLNQNPSNMSSSRVGCNSVIKCIMYTVSCKCDEVHQYPLALVSLYLPNQHNTGHIGPKIHLRDLVYIIYKGL